MASRSRGGLTLIEMLVAMTASLILFGAVATIFQILGDAVGRSRRAGKLDTDLCGIRLRLQQDLAGATVNRDANGVRCETPSGSVSGYFEVIEGPNSDLVDFVAPDGTRYASPYDKSGNGVNQFGQQEWLAGDTDDAIFLTTRNVTLDSFVGRFGSTTITADQAEVAYFCRRTPNTSNPTLFTLYRRQLLIIGGFPRAPFASDGSLAFTTWADFYSLYDLSARREATVDGSGNPVTRCVLNTANDLQRRVNRFGHDPASSGQTTDIAPVTIGPANTVLALAGSRSGEDVVATNVLSFDVQLLDPQAVERQRDDTLRLQPMDRDYFDSSPALTNLATTAPVYGNLGFNALAGGTGAPTAAPGIFGGFGRLGHRLAGTGTTSRTYDSWTSFYRSNNLIDDGTGPADDATEGAPYAEQLPGIQVVVRLYDPDTKTIKQATITQSLKK
jgi:hypothetical protein